MEITGSWPQLAYFVKIAGLFPGVQTWLFGSALTSAAPRDIDVLVIYEDRADVVAIRAVRKWNHFDPPLHIIAMTAEEEHFHQFIAQTASVRIY